MKQSIRTWGMMWLALVCLFNAGRAAPAPAATRAASSGEAQSRRPNIIIILCDDAGYGDFSCYNPGRTTRGANGGPLTPNVDRLAANGMLFTNAHTPSAQCTPTRYSLLTGNHCLRINRTEFVQTDYNDVWLPANNYTLPQMLKEKGYVTHVSGKWHLGYNVRDKNGKIVVGTMSDRTAEPDWSRKVEDVATERGFDTSFGHLDALNNPPWKMLRNDRYIYPQSAWVQSATQFPGVDVINGGGGWIDVDANGKPAFQLETVHRQVQDDVLGKIDEYAGKKTPFFIYVPTNLPHVPTTPHPEFVGKTPHQYTDLIAEIDSFVGLVMAKLEARGILKDTIVIFTSDNGARVDKAFHADHEGVGIVNGERLRGGKCSSYEGGHRVPLIVHWGDPKNGKFVVPANVRSDELIDLTDIMATTAALIGVQLKPEDAVDSYNFLPVWLGESARPMIRRVMINNSQEGHMTIRNIDDDGTEWKLIFSTGSGSSFGGLNGVGTRTSPSLALQDGRWPTVQMYNLTKDVGELHNLLSDGVITAQAKAKARELQQLYWKCQREGRSIPPNRAGRLAL